VTRRGKLREADGKAYTVRYDAVNAMLLNEFLKEHRQLQEQECKLQQQGAIIARQQKQIEELTAGLQKVSAQLEVSNPAAKTVMKISKAVCVSKLRLLRAKGECGELS
jgi:hypothetical protein